MLWYNLYVPQGENVPVASYSPKLSVVIPVRESASPETTLRSLARQTFRDFEVIVSWDHGRGANAARNAGFRLATAPLILFSDDDITWYPDGIARLVNALEANPGAAYAYGAYRMGGRVQCDREFDAAALRRQNYISTMSVIRRDAFPGFDESLRRLQDYDLWLTMLAAGHVGVYCGAEVFSTLVRNGITYAPDAQPYEEALRIVRRKHGL
jgi:glycosyltransferase involved in cell wall biosynthesis